MDAKYLRLTATRPGSSNVISSFYTKRKIPTGGTAPAVITNPAKIRISTDVRFESALANLGFYGLIVRGNYGLTFDGGTKNTFTGYVMFIQLPTTGAIDTARVLLARYPKGPGNSSNTLLNVGMGAIPNVTTEMANVAAGWRRFSLDLEELDNGAVRLKGQGAQADAGGSPDYKTLFTYDDPIANSPLLTPVDTAGQVIQDTAAFFALHPGSPAASPLKFALNSTQVEIWSAEAL